MEPRKYRIYLDTSVIGCLFDDDRPQEQEITHRLWAEMLSGTFDVHISSVALRELNKCHEPKRSALFERAAQLHAVLLDETAETFTLAKEYVRSGVLSSKNFDDCLHIACAVVARCDFLLSWNFRHLVNVTTADSVRIVNSVKRYPEIRIISPAMLIRWEED